MRCVSLHQPWASLPERIRAKIDRTDRCWLWTAYRQPTGYGLVRIGGKRGAMRLAHRVVYELLVGPIPEGLTLDHLCRVRHCVNPDHLEPVTQAENTRRSGPATKTHCVAGHEFTPENTRPRRGGGRICRTCHRLRERERRNR